MATDHGSTEILTRGAERLTAVVEDALRRLDGLRGFGVGSGTKESSGRPATTWAEGRRGDHRRYGVPERLLTPEEHIVDAIERSGGSMRQSEIVDAVDWSESTVSRKLSDLETREEVSRYQIGREKLVCLPGHEPAATRPSLPRADAD